MLKTLAFWKNKKKTILKKIFFAMAVSIYTQIQYFPPCTGTPILGKCDCSRSMLPRSIRVSSFVAKSATPALKIKKDSANYNNKQYETT